MQDGKLRDGDGSLPRMGRRNFLVTAGVSVAASRMGVLNLTTSLFGDEFEPGLVARLSSIDRFMAEHNLDAIIRFDPGTVVSVEICGLMEQMYLMTADGFQRMGNMIARVHTFADVKT